MTAEPRILPALDPNCVAQDQPEGQDVAHDWREVGSDAVQTYESCTRCGRTEPSADHPWRENTIDPIALWLLRGAS